ncbi:MAG: PEGA domain-containing protein [Kofleriaceae bacterium]
MLKAIAIVALMAGTAMAERVVAVAPLSTLGTEDKSAPTKKVLAQVEQALAAQGNKVIASAQVAAAVDKAKKPALRSCEGDGACLAELGKLVGAQVVVSGEVGGLGDSKVIYLSATDVTSGKEMRSTTLVIGAAGGKDDGGASGAAIRLLDPDKYRGTMHFTLDVTGATVFINGSKVTLGAHGEVTMPVGTQAVRVTHPEYHDFIKFIDVQYGKTTEVPVSIQQYPIVEHDVRAHPTNLDKVVYVDPPVWRRWYVIYPVLAAVAIGVGVGVGVAVHDFPFHDNCRTLGGSNC